MENLPAAMTALTIWRPQATGPAAGAEAGAAAGTAEEQKPPLRLEVVFTGSGADSTYTVTLQNASHHSSAAKAAYLLSICHAFIPIEKSLLSSYYRTGRLLHPRTPKEKKAREECIEDFEHRMKENEAVKELMGEFMNVIRKLAVLREKMGQAFDDM
ncbi:MAG: hypothetical protein LQ350_005484 [Teloschistes chrysophthalmus]|nr:MAG: hypothetical protein LQ350_005484 [Niorma chrysophthalma]